jgi:multiple antibiotic resistance protein
MMSREPSRWMTWIGAVLLAWAVCLPIMLASTALRKLLGNRGLTAIERLMGLLLVTIAVQMMMDGVLQFWNAHRP